MSSVSLFALGDHPTKGHKNLHKFIGILCILDEPSDRLPSGGRGHRVTVTKEAAEGGLESLLCMAVDFKPNYDGHSVRDKCGIITSAYIEGNKLMVEGYLYKRDFPEIVSSVNSLDMGMSFELIDAHVVDMRATIWEISKLEFSGAAILLKEKAAYQNTGFIVE